MNPLTAARVLSETLALWPGQAAGQLEIAEFAREDAAALEQARLDACELLFTAQLATGETQVVVEEARRFVAENPFRERAWMSLSLGLYRGGRQADALAAIAELRTTLADGLGLDPSTEVAALEQQILTHDSGLQGTVGCSGGRRVDGQRSVTGTTVRREAPASNGQLDGRLRNPLSWAGPTCSRCSTRCSPRRPAAVVAWCWSRALRGLGSRRCCVPWTRVRRRRRWGGDPRCRRQRVAGVLAVGDGRT